VTFVSNRFGQAGPITVLSYDGQDDLLGFNGSSFQFDRECKLTSGSNGTNTVECAYDGLGRCVSRTVNGVTTYITYFGWSPILETDSSGNISDARVYGLGIDELVADLTASLTPNYFYHQDTSGNVQLLSDPNGNLIERYSYNPFGTFGIYDGNWNPLASSSVGNRFYFQGREYLAGIGIYDFRNRAYSPSLGRFLQSGGHDQVAARLVQAIQDYGLPFIRRATELHSLVELMQSPGFGIAEQLSYRIPAALLILGERVKARDFVEIKLRELESRSDPAALRYRAFGAKLLKRHS
jgi:RHS repeat-associated protein